MLQFKILEIQFLNFLIQVKLLIGYFSIFSLLRLFQFIASVVVEPHACTKLKQHGRTNLVAISSFTCTYITVYTVYLIKYILYI